VFEGLPDFLRIITIHDERLDIKFDAYNNLYDERGTMVTSLLEGAVYYSDNNTLSIAKINELLDIFSSKVSIFTAEVDLMHEFDVAVKYMEVFWYRKKSLADYIGVSWKPSQDVYKTLEEGLKNGPGKKGVSPPNGWDLVEELTQKYDFSEYLNSKKVV
jgi:hypothetical protein